MKGEFHRPPFAVLDDHLLRDVLIDDKGFALRRLTVGKALATTNLYLQRLCRSAVNARGGALTGSWPEAQRRELGRGLAELPSKITVVPMQALAYRMAELTSNHRLSTLGAEAVAAAEYLQATLLVWDGDDGPGIRGAMTDLGLAYQTVAR